MKQLLLGLKNNGGVTLKNYYPVNFKSGYQVATSGKETKDIEEAVELIKKYNGNCGIWKSNDVYYIDKSKRIATLKKAVTLGKMRKQQSILKWKDKSLIWINKKGQ